MFCRAALFGFFTLAVPLMAIAQTVTVNPPQKTTTPEQARPQSADYSSEPFVIERYYTTVRFENDGTGERDVSARVRINSEAGAQQFRELVFTYNATNEKVEVRSISVRKADGTVVDRLTPDAVKDMSAAITRSAPAYGDYKEKHVHIGGLQAGDLLEYRVATLTVSPVAHSQFWLQYNFLRDAIVLDERVELSLPWGRAFSIKSPGYQRISGTESRPAPATPLKASGYVFTTSSEGGRTILLWRHTNTSLARENGQQKAANPRGKPADLQLTSFENWDGVAHWFAEAEKGRAEPSGTVKAKTRELIRGATSEADKIRALSDYVSKKIRYVDVSLDVTRVGAHSAAEVLANGYGDSQDKRVLLAAMLEGAGIHSNAVLVPSALKLDEDLPSPAQFDRIITALAEDGRLIWLDPETEVAPFGYLPAGLRGKPGLLVNAGGTGKIVETPADPPFASMQHVEVDGQISELGKLTGVIHYSLRGDAEFVLRSAFHRSSQAQWNQLGQTILSLNGIRALVIELSTSDPLTTDKPFELNIEFAELNVLDWPSKKTRIALPLLTIQTPDAPTENDQSIKLGTPVAVTARLKLKLPASLTVQAPVGVAVSRDYAEYKSAYRQEDNTLIVDRSLSFKAHELPAERAPDYLAFAHAVKADEAQTLAVENPAASLSNVPSSTSADDVFEAGAAALKLGNTEAAIALLERATALEPKHRQAWNVLGLACMQAGKFEDAVAAFRKQMEVNPSDEQVNDYLGLALDRLQRDDEAADAFRKQIEAHPLDTIAHAALGSILLDEHRYPEAVLELEKGAVLSPDNPQLRVSLGRAYLNTGNKSKAMESFQEAIELSPTPGIQNDVAFSLADKGVELDRAKEYAESAIKATAENLGKANLSQVTVEQFAEVSSIGDYWDTLGWIYFQGGDVAQAERYVRAAWHLNQRGEVGDHLAQILEKRGEKDGAIHQYALSLAAPHAVPDTRARLMLLLGGNAQIEELVKKARPELERERTFEVTPVPQGVNGEVSADFLILVSPGGGEGNSTKIDDIEFLKGSESLRGAADLLRAIDLGAVFPAGSVAKVIRRGTLSCWGGAPKCRLVLWLPEQVVAGQNLKP